MKPHVSRRFAMKSCVTYQRTLLLGRRMQGSMILLLFATCGMLGCGRSVPQFEVSGNVRLDRTPIASGAVIFVPHDGNQNPVSFVVNDGRFHSADGQGLPEGDYSVVIAPFAFELEQYESQKSENADLLRPPRIPEAYTKPGKLSAKVTPGSDNSYTFELSSDDDEN